MIVNPVPYEKNYYLLLLLLSCALNFGFGQVKIAEINFEVPGGYTTSIAEYTNVLTGNGQDYFIRTNGSNISSEVFTNIQGDYYFGAQDIDNGDTILLPVTFNIDDINISGYENLEFRVYLAEDDDGATNQDRDNPDYVHFKYDIDNSGTFTDLNWIENDGSPTNSEPFIDTDFDGIGDGTEITNNFQQFIEAIAGTGNLLDIEIEFSLDAGDEDIAIDNIEIWGTLATCTATATWDGITWDNVIGPDTNTAAIINGPYSTGVSGSLPLATWKLMLI